MKGSSVTSLIFFVGVLLILVGLYGFVRIVHITLRGVPYPMHGVIPATILTPGESISYWGRESECDSYPQVYYESDKDGNQIPRKATKEELAMQEQSSKRCVVGFNEDRAKQNQYDKNQSAFLVFVGAGLVLARRFLQRTRV